MIGMEKISGGWRVTTDKGVFEARCVMNAAGVLAENVHNMAAKPSFTSKTSRGEYYLLDTAEGDTLAWQGHAFEILDLDGSRIDKILVTARIAGDGAPHEPLQN